MTAIVKHISVHPKFRYARRVGIFDELDKREAEAKRKQNARRQAYKQTAFGYHYSSSHLSPSPEK